MPRIDSDIKLDFKDVLFRPKRSTLKSRAEVRFTKSFRIRMIKIITIVKWSVLQQLGLEVILIVNTIYSKCNTQIVLIFYY